MMRIVHRHPHPRGPGLLARLILIARALAENTILPLDQFDWRLRVMPENNCVLRPNSVGEPVLEAVVRASDGDGAGEVNVRDRPIVIFLSSLRGFLHCYQYEAERGRERKSKSRYCTYLLDDDLAELAGGLLVNTSSSRFSIIFHSRSIAVRNSIVQ